MKFINLILVGILIYFTREFEIIFFIVSAISFLFSIFIIFIDIIGRPKDYDKLHKISELKLEKSGLNPFDEDYKTKKDDYDKAIADATRKWNQVSPNIHNILEGHPEKKKVYEKYHLFFKSPHSFSLYSDILTFFLIYFFALIIFFLFDWTIYKVVISCFLFFISVKYAAKLNPHTYSTSNDSKTVKRKQFILDIQKDLGHINKFR